MGKQTCVVMVGFIALHLAVILSIISLSTPEWVSAHSVNGSVKVNRTNHCDLGLWQVCCDECNRLNDTVQTPAFRATIALNMVGAATLVMGLVLTYVFLFGERMKTSTMCAGLLAIIIIFGTLSLLTAIILFGIKYEDLSDFPVSYISELGWSYYVGVAGVVFACLSSVTSTGQFCLIKSRPVGYEDL